jgi:hypothetical protein
MYDSIHETGLDFMMLFILHEQPRVRAMDQIYTRAVRRADSCLLSTSQVVATFRCFSGMCIDVLRCSQGREQMA